MVLCESTIRAIAPFSGGFWLFLADIPHVLISPSVIGEERDRIWSLCSTLSKSVGNYRLGVHTSQISDVLRRTFRLNLGESG